MKVALQIMTGVLVLVLLGFCIIPPPGPGRLDAANRTITRNNAQWIALALKAYKEKTGHYPSGDPRKIATSLIAHFSTRDQFSNLRKIKISGDGAFLVLRCFKWVEHGGEQYGGERP